MKWMEVGQEEYDKKYDEVMPTFPNENVDYLVLKEDGTMDVCKGRFSDDYYDFLWDTEGYVLFYSKLPKRPKGYSERSLQKKANAEKRKKRKIAKENEGKTGVGTMYDIFPWLREAEEKYGK